jgi:methionine synthase I (cobalamin-dependent)
MRNILTLGDGTVGDGGMATSLQARGLALGTAPELWNLTHSEEVIAVHRNFAAAGAAWVQTNTFGGTRTRLALAGLDHELVQVNREAVRCAREGAGENVPVLASLGPSGARSGAREADYAEQCEVLAEAGVDGYIIETIVSLEEGLAAVRSAVRCGAELVIASYTPDPEGRLFDGAPPELAGEALRGAGASVVGVNCGSGPESLLVPLQRLAGARLGPLFAAPNAGVPLVSDGGVSYGLSPDGFARHAIHFREVGVQFIAGCCGTIPEHVRAAAAALLSVPASRRDPS